MCYEKVKNMNKRAIGESYEKEAGVYLEKQGYQIIQYNYRCKRGEIDIIAQHEQTLVFCEVKYRKDSKRGHPLETVTKRKQQMIIRCALYYLTEKHMDRFDVRFDVIGILGTEIEWVQGAFECG